MFCCIFYLDLGFLGRLFINFGGRNTILKQQNPENLEDGEEFVQVEKTNKRISNPRFCSVLGCTSTEENYVLHRPFSKRKLSEEKGELWYSKLICKPYWAKRNLRVCSLHFIAGNFKCFLIKGKIFKNL